MHRRTAIQSLSRLALGFAALREFNAHAQESEAAGYGPLLEDPQGLLNLPKGFSYKAISRVGERMDDGLHVPALHDGMACFATNDPDRVIIIRNHEIRQGNPDEGPYKGNAELFAKMDAAKIFDRGKGVKPAIGGTTTLTYNLKTRVLERHHLSLTGTMQNCAGGKTPWGTWVSCEEVTADPKKVDTLEQSHGYNFEVPASARGLVTPFPLKAMGRFVHEAIAVHPSTQVVYQTEDSGNSLIYRFLPDASNSLHRGKLQALAVKGQKTLDTRNQPQAASTMPVGEVFEVEWIDLEDIQSPNDDLRLQGAAKGAAVFARGEGAFASEEAIWWVSTSGGKARKGQVFRYVPSPYEGQPAEKKYPGRLELFLEPNDASRLDNPDNICAAPHGDLFLSEDGPGPNFVVGFYRRGVLYPFAKNILNGSEMAGPCFSPDGSTLFVNIQNPGITFAITGPWKHKAGRTA
jgi:secreted PhoX family phosphatase